MSACNRSLVSRQHGQPGPVLFDRCTEKRAPSGAYHSKREHISAFRTPTGWQCSTNNPMDLRSPEGESVLSTKRTAHRTLRRRRGDHHQRAVMRDHQVLRAVAGYACMPPVDADRRRRGTATAPYLQPNQDRSTPRPPVAARSALPPKKSPAMWWGCGDEGRRAWNLFSNACFSQLLRPLWRARRIAYPISTLSQSGDSTHTSSDLRA